MLRKFSFFLNLEGKGNFIPSTRSLMLAFHPNKTFSQKFLNLYKYAL